MLVPKTKMALSVTMVTRYICFYSNVKEDEIYSIWKVNVFHSGITKMGTNVKCKHNVHTLHIRLQRIIDYWSY